MKAFVTGGLGFIGSHLVERLLSLGHEVVVVDNETTGQQSNLSHLSQNNNLKFLFHDIRTPLPQNILDGKFDTVFHLAALADIVPSIEQPERYFHTNVTGTLNILEAARQWPLKKFIYAASSSCYGIPRQYPTPESALIQPQYPYALTKYLGEQTALHWGKVFKLPVLSLRFFNVYGPRSRTTGAYGAVFGVFLAQKLAGQPLTIVGNGEQKRDFTYVTDVVEAMIMASKSSLAQDVFNVGSGQCVTVNTLANLIGGNRVYIPKRPGEPDCTFADIGHIQDKLGWKPKVGFEEGVSKMLEQISYWKQAPIWTPQSIENATRLWFEYLK